MSDENEIDELSKQILKYGLMMSQAAQELTTNFSGQEVEQSIIDMGQRMIENSEEPNQQISIAMMVENMGNRFGSEQLAEQGQMWQEQIQEAHA